MRNRLVSRKANLTTDRLKTPTPTSTKLRIPFCITRLWQM